jgi:TolA-binding protein
MGEKLRSNFCATLLLLSSSVLAVDVARAQGQTPGSGSSLLPQTAPLAETLPLPPAAPSVDSKTTDNKTTDKKTTDSKTGDNQAAAATRSGTETPATSPSDATRAAYEQAFAQSLEKPSDPQTLVHFAETAVAVGDIEGAISALERLLLIDGDQPDVKLELGVLYYRLGSTEAARAYLQDVSSSNDASGEDKERANTFLQEMKKP